jgi:Na+/melibiose symporter-like transporter
MHDDLPVPESPGPSPASSPSARWQAAFASGALGTQVVFAAAPAFVPLLLEQRFRAPASTIGVVLALAPAVGLVALPVACLASDRLRTRWGQRLPLLALAAPLTVAGLLGLAWARSIAGVALATALVFTSINAFLGPYRAAFGELVPKASMNRVSGAQAALKGLGSLLVLSVGLALFQWSDALPFVVVAGLFALAAAAALGAVATRRPQAGPAVALAGGPRDLLRAGRGLERLFVAHACWWFAMHGLFAFTIPFAIHDLAGVADAASPAGRAAEAAAIPVLATFAIVGMVASLPMARLADRFGAARVLLFGVAAAAVGTASATACTAPAQGYVFSVLGGLGFAAIQSLAYPLLAARRPRAPEGAFAALFEIGVDVPQVVAVAVLGALASAAASYRVVFAAATAALGLAAALLVPTLREEAALVVKDAEEVPT